MAESLLGLSIPHKSPRPASDRWPVSGAGASDGGISAEACYSVDVAVRATFVQLKGSGIGGRGGGGTRGRVSGFSRASRKRLLDRLNSVPDDVLADALFITLTLPDAALDRWQAKPAAAKPRMALGVRGSKGALARFTKRLRRAWPRCAGVWRMERVPRLSGDYAGELVPHYHVLVFNVPWMETGWLASAWYECVASADSRHLQAGTSVQRVRSRRGAMSYVAKYMCKEESAAAGEHTGRYWGVFGDAWLEVIIRTYELTARQFYRLRRVLRAYVLKSWRPPGAVRCRWARAPGQGCTAYLSEASALRLVAWAAEA